MHNKKNNTGLKRIWNASKFSLAGLKESFMHEAAFRQELALFTILLPIIIILPVPVIFKILLFSVNCLVLIVELLNSAIEAVVDMTSPDYHDLAKRAKDMARASVFIALLLASTTWATACYMAII